MKFANLVILCALSVTLVSCGSKKSDKAPGQPAVNDEAKSELVSLTEHSYEFTETLGCTTGKQTFDSDSKLCTGLQNNTLNSDCAIDQRQKYFTEKCSGDFSAFTVNKEGNKEYEVRLPGFETVKLPLGNMKVDLLKVAPDYNSNRASALTFFSCMDHATVKYTKNPGFTLLNGSKAVINRDLDYIFKDGSRADRLIPHALLDCEKYTKDSPLSLNENDVITKKLSLHQTALFPVIMSPEGSKKVVELTFISCTDDALSITKSGINGVMLMKGASVVFKRDVFYFSNPTDLREQVLVTCN